MSVYHLSPKQTSEALETLIASRQSAFLVGGPGIGKSQVVAQTCERLGLLCHDVRAVLLDPVDLRGLPHINSEGRAHWATPDFLPRDGNGVLFLDELNRAPVLVQNACFQLILDRRLGEYEMPDGWTIVAAGNRESDGGGVTKMPAALANRFTHISCEPDLQDWCVWALTHQIEPVVIAFLKFRTELLYQFSRTEYAFPTPRSWSFVSSVIGKTPNRQVEQALIAGSVGEAAGTEFCAYLQLYRNLPSIDTILLNPQSAPVPEDMGTLYAVSSALSHRMTEQNIGRVVTYLDRLPREYGVFAMKDAVVRDSALDSTPEFTKWGIAHGDVL